MLFGVGVFRSCCCCVFVCLMWCDVLFGVGVVCAVFVVFIVYCCGVSWSGVLCFVVM